MPPSSPATAAKGSSPADEAPRSEPVHPPLPVEQQLAVHYTVARAFAEAERLDDAAPVVLRALAAAFGWQAANLWLPGDDGTELACVAAHSDGARLDGWLADTRTRRFERGVGLPGRVWETGEAIWISDTDRDELFARRELAQRAGLRHGFAFPVRVGGAVGAVVELFAGEVRDVDRAQSAFLESVGHQLGSFIERTQARQAVAISEARKTGILNGALDAIVSSDAGGRIIEFNRAAEEMFGFRREDVLGRTVVNVIVPDDQRAAHVNGLRRYNETGEPRIIGRRVRTWAKRADGTRLPIELTVTEVRLGGESMFTAFIRDISREREAEIARERFLEILSHELRTPVTALYGGAKILSRRDIDERRRREYLGEMADEADRLYRLIEDLIVLARAERGQLPVSLDPIRLERVAERVIKQFRDNSPLIEFKLSVAGHGPPVRADETYVVQLLRNLLSNAVKYGGGSQVEVEVENAEEESVVRVLDRGIGIDPAEINQLFEIDFRSPLSEGLAYGSGIGLFVARWLVQAMGGRIWAQSRDGGGSEFGFALNTLDADVAPESIRSASTGL